MTGCASGVLVFGRLSGSMSANVENLSSLGCSSWQQECCVVCVRSFFFSLLPSSCQIIELKRYRTGTNKYTIWNVAARSMLQTLKCVFYFKFKHLTFHPQTRATNSHIRSGRHTAKLRLDGKGIRNVNKNDYNCIQPPFPVAVVFFLLH